jgi:uncharacterized protein (TIGR02145 family)
MIFFKKVAILIMFTAVIASCKKEEKSMFDCDKFKVEKQEHTCNSYTFTSNAYEYNPYWNVYTVPSDTPKCYGKNSSSFNFNPTEPGKYTVEAVYENVHCPQGVKVSYDINVLGECFQDSTTSCDDIDVQVVELSCYSFSIKSNLDNPFWSINGIPQNNKESDLNFNPTAAGSYSIKVGYVNQNCPDSATKEVIIEVNQDCFQDVAFDCDGNAYKTVTIGDQTWMAENLRTTKYNDCTPIELAEDSAYWVEKGVNSLGLYCYYNNDPNKYAATSGALYNWHAVNTDNLCPTGWHVPTDDEWTTFESYLSLQGLLNVWSAPNELAMGTALKSTTDWGSSANGTDLYGWNALPSGHRNRSNHFFEMDDPISGNSTYYWSSSESPGQVWHRRLSTGKTLYRDDLWGKTFGVSVRCLKD